MFALRDNENNLSIASQAWETAEHATSIAKETKKDSSTMTSIAALTMVFLPGTFVAVSSQSFCECQNTNLDTY